MSAGLCVVSAYFLFADFGATTANSLTVSRLVKTENSSTVFYVNEYGLKIPFPTAEIFLSYKNKWQDIQIVSEAEIDFYKSAKYIRLVGSKKVYFLQNNLKQFVEEKFVKQIGIAEKNVIVVNKKEFNFYKIGKQASLVDLGGVQSKIISLENSCKSDQTTGGEAGCKIFTALEKQDINICFEIESEVWRAKCFESLSASTEKVLEACRSLQNKELKTNCISQVAFRNQNQNVCQILENKNEQDFCESKLAIKQKQTTACDKLIGGDSEVGKNYCLFIFATVHSNSAVCEKIASESKYKNSCTEIIYSKVAFREMLKPLRTSLFASLSKIKLAQAQTSVLTGAIPVGGKFLAGAFDIYTPTPYPPCMLVTVVGPSPGIFNFLPTFIYDYFIEAPTHINLNMLGVARILPPCPPTLYMLGSGLRPESF